MRRAKFFSLVVVMLLSCVLCGRFALAQGGDQAREAMDPDTGAEYRESDGEEDKPGAQSNTVYIEIKPPFRANFGGMRGMRYLKTEIVLRVESSAARNVRHHMPAIRDALLMLLSRQTEDAVTTMEGKEMLRQELLQAAQETVAAEEGEHGITDLLFNSFIVQR